MPIVLPFASAVLALMLKSREKGQRLTAPVGAGLHLFGAIMLLIGVRQGGIAATQIGNWPAPFGITLVADHLSAVMVLITAIIYLSTVIYSQADIDSKLAARGYYPLLHTLTGGICGAFLTGDLFNLYVWFEVMLMASFGLLVLGQERRQLDGGVKYVVINLFSTLLMLTGIGLVYGLTGTLNMADLHVKIKAVDDQGLVTAIAMLFMGAFGIKSALFPLFFWLPASYHTPPVSISAIFSGLLTKVGVYALIRMFTLVFSLDVPYLYTVMLAAAALTMVTGVLGAAAHSEFRRILSFHIISQVGYMVLGLALNSALALAGAVFYLIHHIVVKANLFLVSGVVRRVGGSFELPRLGGIYRTHGFLALLFFIPAFSLAGFPPLSGFWAKMILIRASIEIDQFLPAAVAAAVGLYTVYSMTKIWGEVFWKPAPADESGQTDSVRRPSGWMIAPIVLLALLTVMMGLGVEPLFKIASTASEELRNPDMYLIAVLGVK
jgi:multicomponent Na+:H+ antiporter subunit D